MKKKVFAVIAAVLFIGNSLYAYSLNETETPDCASYADEMTNLEEMCYGPMEDWEWFEAWSFFVDYCEQTSPNLTKSPEDPAFIY